MCLKKNVDCIITGENIESCSSAGASAVEFHNQTTAAINRKAHEIVETMSRLSQKQLKETLHVSDTLASLNFNRYKHFMDQESTAAILAFDGQAFKGLTAREMTRDEMVRLKSLRVIDMSNA